MTTDKKPWFLMMRPEDANKPGSQWVRAGAASRGKVVWRPIAPEGWIVLLVFVFGFPFVNYALFNLVYAVWGDISKIQLVVLLVLEIVVWGTGFGLLMRSRTTRMPPGNEPV